MSILENRGKNGNQKGSTATILYPWFTKIEKKVGNHRKKNSKRTLDLPHREPQEVGGEHEKVHQKYAKYRTLSFGKKVII